MRLSTKLLINVSVVLFFIAIGVFLLVANKENTTSVSNIVSSLPTEQIVEKTTNELTIPADTKEIPATNPITSFSNQNNKIHRELANQIEENPEQTIKVLIKRDSSQSKALEKKIKETKGKVNSQSDDYTVVEIPANKLQELAEDKAIEAIYPERKYQALLDTAINITDIPTFWNSNFTGDNIRIAILDTGIDGSHEMFTGKIISEAAFTGENHTNDANGHGTHVAGIAAGNGLYKGVAPDAKLMNAKVLKDDGSGTTSSIIEGIEWAIDPDNNPSTDDGADIISMSIGGTYSTPDQPLIDAINKALSKGIVVVVSSGNCGSGCPSDSCGSFRGVTTPGNLKEVITVGAVDKNKNISCFSGGENIVGVGIKPDVVAPAVNIISAAPNNNYVRMSGTSMAAPYIAGAAALLLEKFPSSSPTEIKQLLESTASDLGVLGKDISYGSGIINMSAAFNWYEETTELSVEHEKIIEINKVIHLNITIPPAYPIQNLTATIKRPDNSTIQLIPQKTSETEYSAEFADTTLQGVYYITVSFSMNNGTNIKESQFQVYAPSEKIGRIVNVEHQNSINQGADINAVVTYENTGANTLQMTVENIISDKGIVIASFESSQTYYVNAGATAPISINWTQDIKPGDYEFKIIIRYVSGFIEWNDSINVIDSTAPQVLNISFTDRTTSNNPFLLNILASDSADISGTLNIRTPDNKINIITANIAYKQNNTALTALFHNTSIPGTYNFNYTLCDSSNNCFSSENKQFIIDSCSGKPILVLLEQPDSEFKNIAKANYCVAEWNLLTSMLPPQEYLNKFDAIIWSFGNKVESVDSDKISLVKNMLNSGTKIIIEGNDFALANNNAEILRDGLYANFKEDFKLDSDSALNMMLHPVTAGISSLTIKSAADSYPDSISSRKGFCIAEWQSSDCASFVYGYNSTKIVYLGFSIESISEQTSKEKLVLNSLSWLTDNNQAACYSNADCGYPETTKEPFCQNNSIAFEQMIHTCENPATSQASCSNTPQTTVTEQCEFGCSNATCLEQQNITDPIVYSIDGQSADGEIVISILENTTKEVDILSNINSLEAGIFETNNSAAYVTGNKLIINASALQNSQQVYSQTFSTSSTSGSSTKEGYQAQTPTSGSYPCSYPGTAWCYGYNYGENGCVSKVEIASSYLQGTWKYCNINGVTSTCYIGPVSVNLQGYADTFYLTRDFNGWGGWWGGILNCDSEGPTCAIVDQSITKTVNTGTVTLNTPPSVIKNYAFSGKDITSCSSGGAFWSWYAAGYSTPFNNMYSVNCVDNFDCSAGQLCDNRGSWETWQCIEDPCKNVDQTSYCNGNTIVINYCKWGASYQNNFTCQFGCKNANCLDDPCLSMNCYDQCNGFDYSHSGVCANSQCHYSIEKNSSTCGFTPPKNYDINIALLNNDKRFAKDITVSVLPPLPELHKTGLNCGTLLNESIILTSDLKNCSGMSIMINKNNIILDCDGHTINGMNNGNVGIYNYMNNNLTIKNCIIKNFKQQGIFFSGVSGINIINSSIINSKMNVINGNKAFINNSIFTNNTNGLEINTAADVIIENSRFISNSGKGLVLNKANNITVMLSQFIGNNDGIFIRDSVVNNHIKDNLITNNSNGIYNHLNTSNFIYHNAIHNNTAYNIYDLEQNKEYSYNNEGNYWGHSTQPLFIAGTDSTYISNKDSYPYAKSFFGSTWPAPPVIIIDLCSNVTCSDYCSNFTQYSNGTCSLGICSYATITDNSTQCNWHTPTCNLDSDCGTNNNSINYCNGNTTYQNSTTFKCNNPGSQNATCTTNTTQKLNTTCQFGCQNGVCKPDSCLNISCNDYCTNLTQYSNGACNLGVCNYTTTKQNATECGWHAPICKTNSDCGVSGYIGQKYCNNYAISQDFISFSCNIGNNSEKYCTNQTSIGLINYCEFGCINAECQSAWHIDPVCGQNIWKSSIFTDDLENCSNTYAVFISGSNLTLDCNGHSIKGNGSSGGIWSSNQNNVTIKNCNIYNFSSSGILLDGGSNNTITNISTNNCAIGVDIQKSNNFNISSSQFKQSKNPAIQLYSTTKGTIESVTISFNRYGIFINTAENISIKNSVISNNQIGILGMNGTNVFISDNLITNHTITEPNYEYSGIYLMNGNYNIFHNAIYNNTKNIEGFYPLEVSYNNEGNYWGHTSKPFFIDSKSTLTNKDTIRDGIIDSNPYGKSFIGSKWPAPPGIDLCANITCSNYCTNYTYYSAGTCNTGTCSYATIKQNATECGWKLPICYTDSDCGTNSYSNNYCNINRVYRNNTVFKCNNAGAVNSFCTNTTTPQSIESCSLGCNGDKCEDTWSTNPTCEMYVSRNTKFLSDLPNCSTPVSVWILSGNLILDCAGHAITGLNNQSPYISVNGIIFQEVNNVTIKNCNISGFNDGIYVYHGSNNTIINTSVDKMRNSGISVYASNKFNITNVKAKYTNTGMQIYESSNGIVDSFEAYNNNLGLTFYNVNNSIFKNSYIHHNINTGLIISPTTINNSVYNNIISNNPKGLTIYKENLNKVYHNAIFNNTLNLESNSQIEVSYNNKGNYWGHSTPLFFTAGTDSNNITVVDSYPYGKSFIGSEWPAAPGVEVDACWNVTCSNYCSNFTQYSAGTCSSGACNYTTKQNATECGWKKPECYTDTDCGSEKWNESLTCQNNNVFKNYTIFKCSFPGAAYSKCNLNVITTLNESCQFGCNNGACEPDPCLNINCNPYCTGFTYYSNGICNNGQCSYSEQQNSSQCNWKAPDCYSDSDCGTPDWSDSRICSNGDVYDNYKTPVCSNAGTSAASCEVTTELRQVQDCQFGCQDNACLDDPCNNIQCNPYCDGFTLYSAGSCSNSACTYSDVTQNSPDCGWINPACNSNAECGTPRWENNLYCNNGNVYDTYTTPICNNPGQQTASCTETSEGKIKTTCQFECENGACKEDPCTGISCESYCNEYTYYSNGACSNGQCSFSEQQNSPDCGWINPACNSNAECGTPRWENNLYCNNGNVYDTYTTPICNNPGQQTASCTETSEGKIKTTCQFECENGVCKEDPCTGISCESYCDGFTYYTHGACSNGACSYSAQQDSTQCQIILPKIIVPKLKVLLYNLPIRH